MFDVLDGKISKDTDIRRFADSENFVLLTKDKDFVASHISLRSPQKLVKINLGNLVNRELLSIFERNWATMIQNLANATVMIELDRKGLILHDAD